ncbi:hypothetical protein BT69DRAFT_1340550 [Atractiella rhizophila]|nr:hypothetical protein BT69DRAFT_1340550 [Atractiella rhizophila]
MTSIADLPKELLIVIFKECLSTIHKKDGHVSYREFFEIVLALRSVCGFWNDLVCDMVNTDRNLPLRRYLKHQSPSPYILRVIASYPGLFRVETIQRLLLHDDTFSFLGYHGISSLLPRLTGLSGLILKTKPPTDESVFKAFTRALSKSRRLHHLSITAQSSQLRWRTEHLLALLGLKKVPSCLELWGWDLTSSVELLSDGIVDSRGDERRMSERKIKNLKLNSCRVSSEGWRCIEVKLAPLHLLTLNSFWPETLSETYFHDFLERQKELRGLVLKYALHGSSEELAKRFLCGRFCKPCDSALSASTGLADLEIDSGHEESGLVSQHLLSSLQLGTLRTLKLSYCFQPIEEVFKFMRRVRDHAATPKPKMTFRIVSFWADFSSTEWIRELHQFLRHTAHPMKKKLSIGEGRCEDKDGANAMAMDVGFSASFVTPYLDFAAWETGGEPDPDFKRWGSWEAVD